MLVLSRKERQTILIGNEEIELTVLEVHGSTVKLGFKAPADVSIVRGELCFRVESVMEPVGTIRSA